MCQKSRNLIAIKVLAIKEITYDRFFIEASHKRNYFLLNSHHFMTYNCNCNDSGSYQADKKKRYYTNN